MRIPMGVRSLCFLSIYLGTLAQAAVDVGVARVDITPTEPIRLSGYLARKEASQGVSQKIWAKAIAIGSDSDGPALLITVDSLGIPEPMVDALATKLAPMGITRDRLTIAASHTHSAPMVQGVAPNIFGRAPTPQEQAPIDRYTRLFEDALEQVAKLALADRSPCELGWTAGSVNFALNRRTKGGPVDHALPVLVAKRADGGLRAVLINYACHCTSIPAAENIVHGDWAGVAQLELEQAHPGILAFTVIGCGADANPRRATEGRTEVVNGTALAKEVERVLKGKIIPLKGRPATRITRVSLPFDTLPTRLELEALVKAGGPPGYNAETQLGRLAKGQPLQSALDYPVQTWAFDDQLLMVFLAGEVVVDYVTRLKLELDSDRVWVTAYANDAPCYIPSDRILNEGGYEGAGAMVYYGKPTKLKLGIEDAIISAVKSITPAAFFARPK